MLLRHTTDIIIDREALTVNPAKTCQPVGAMYAALGVHGCLPHSHGSQGCCSYHRSMLTRHYKEPVMAATSSFTEGASVFGGQANFLQAVNTIFTTYEPDIIAAHTTCLSETIGEDLTQMSQKARDEGKIPAGKHVVGAATPSYVGSHITGYANQLTSFVKYFAENTGDKTKQVNILTGWCEPSDMREIKNIASSMGVQYVMLPDTSDVLDAPMNGKFKMFPKGGTTIPEMVSMGNARRTLALGHWCTKDAAIALENSCKVPFVEEDLPFGIKATDRFVQALSKLGSVTIPDSVTDDRGRLVDMITDMHQYLHGKRVALWGDPDVIIPVAEFLTDIDMKPVYIVSGTPGKHFMQRMESILSVKVPEAKYKNGERADLFLLHQWIKQEGVDLLIGNTHGKYIARDENIPLVRLGFPIIDRVGHSYFPLVGYKGGMRLVENILNAILNKFDAECPEEKVELVL